MSDYWSNMTVCRMSQFDNFSDEELEKRIFTESGAAQQAFIERWPPSFGQENAEIKLGSQVPLD